MSKEIKIHISLHQEGSRLTDIEEFSFSELEEMISYIKEEINKNKE